MSNSAREAAQAAYDRADQLGENLVPSEPPAALMGGTDEVRTYKPGQLPPDQRDQLQENLVPGPAPAGQEVDGIRTYTNAQLPPDMRDNLQENLVPYPTNEAPDGKRTYYDEQPLPEGLRDHLGEDYVPNSAPITGDETESPV